MPIQRYDVVGLDGKFQPRCWKPVNWPILDDAGSVIALVHHVVKMPMRETGPRLSSAAYSEELRQTTQELLTKTFELVDEAELLARQREALTRGVNRRPSRR